MDQAAVMDVGAAKPPRDGSVQSVDRAISILQVLARRGVTGVTAIGRELSLNKSTVSRLLGTLQARGLVEHVPGRGGYRLDYGVVLLAEGASRKPDLVLTSREICAELAEDLGETVNVIVLEGGRSVTIDQVIGSASLTTVNWVGRRDPLHVTSSGKVFLAEMSPTELDQHLAGGLERFTEHTIVDPAVLRAQLAQVRERGYGWAVEEQEVGLVAIAAPVRALDGRLIAAISLSGPTFRLSEEMIPELAVRVQAAAARISERNGHPKAG